MLSLTSRQIQKNLPIVLLQQSGFKILCSSATRDWSNQGEVSQKNSHRLHLWSQSPWLWDLHFKARESHGVLEACWGEAGHISMSCVCSLLQKCTVKIWEVIWNMCFQLFLINSNNMNIFRFMITISYVNFIFFSPTFLVIIFSYHDV